MVRKLLRAAGFELVASLRAAPSRAELDHCARQLVQVLDLADVLPQRSKGPLRFPPSAG